MYDHKEAYAQAWGIAEELAPLLEPAGAWTVRERQPDQVRPIIDGPDGAELWLYPYGGRLEITGMYPDGWTKLSLYHAGGECAESHKVTAAMDRPVKAIAGHVARKLLPDYLPDLAIMREKIAAHRKHENTGADNARQLREALRAPWDDSMSRYGKLEQIRWSRHDVSPGGYGDLRVSGDHVTFELALPFELALEVARVLATWEPAS
jgi:hypothetical protein